MTSILGVEVIIMPFDLCLKCSECGGRLIHLRTEGDQDIFQCASCSRERTLKTVYTKRFKKHTHGRIPEHCPTCRNPARQEVKEIDGKLIIKCGICNDEFVYDKESEEWISINEGVGA